MTMLMMKLIYIIIMMYFMILILITFNLYYIKYDLYHPINQMIFLLIMILSFAIYLFMSKENSIYCLLLLITFISGILVMFSYFTALNNVPLNEFKYFMLIFVIVLLVLIMNLFMLSLNNYFNLMLFFNNINFDYLMINEIFMLTKVHILILMMLMLIMIMYMSTKMALLKNYPLRSNSK